MEHRPATGRDLDLLAQWNHQLVRDEGHRNQMAVPELRERMTAWLSGEYEAVIFLVEANRLLTRSIGTTARTSTCGSCLWRATTDVRESDERP